MDVVRTTLRCIQSLYLPEHIVFSSILQALESTYVNGRACVVHAPPSQGKTVGPRDILERFLPALRDEDTNDIASPRGLMITGTPDKAFFSYMTNLLPG
jgi:hypothetical protein